MLKFLCTFLLVPTMFLSGINDFSPTKNVFAEEVSNREAFEQEINTEDSLGINKNPKETEPHTYNSSTFPIHATIDAQRVEYNEQFNVLFSIDCSQDYSFSYEDEGFSICSMPLHENNQISVDLKATLESSSPVFTLNLIIDGQYFSKATIYGFVNEYGLFLSTASYDDAWSYHLQYLIETQIISEEEAEDMQNVQNRVGIEEEIIYSEQNSNIMTRGTANTWVKGRLQWRDDNGNLHPLQFTAVEVFDDDVIFEDVLGECFTDENGDFSCAFENQTISTENGGCDPYIVVYAIGEGYNIVIDKKSGSGYSTESSHYGDVATGSTTTINMTFTMNNDLGRAFQILQAAVTLSRYATQMDSTGTDLGLVRIQYPYDGSGCYYSNNRIYITGDSPVSGFPQSYASWDVIMHEYGHHLQYVYDIIDSPGAGHYVDANMVDHYAGSNHSGCGCAQPGAAQAKYEGIRLAWGESWNTVIGIMAQQYYSSILQNIPTVGDTNYRASNGVDYSVERPHILGEGCEVTNCGVLYDLYDSYSSQEATDSISWGHYQFFRLTTASGAYTLSDFVNYLLENNSVNAINLGNILSLNEISPTDFRANSDISTTPPTFSWSHGNEGDTNAYRNNSFQLAFFNSLGEEVLRTGEISTTSYTLTSSEWEVVLKSYGTTFSAGVYGFQLSTPTTGGYLSNTVQYSKPTPTPISETKTFSSSSRCLEKIISLQPSQYFDYHITFDTSGSKLIQTFGAKDTVIELYSASGTLLKSVSDTDDKGYGLNAFIKYYMNANTTYIIRVKFYSSNEGGQTKLLITNAYTVWGDGYDAINNYEQIFNINHENYTWYTYSQQYYTKVITFTPPTSGTYTIALESEFDNYLYILDPRSSAANVPGIDFNDDSNGYNASITRELEAGVPYFIIYCPYNPAREFTDLDSGDDLVLSISKN